MAQHVTCVVRYKRYKIRIVIWSTYRDLSIVLHTL